MLTVLLLGGTGDRRLAGLLAGRPGLRVVTSLAGRVSQLAPEQSTDAIVVHHPEANYFNAK